MGQINVYKSRIDSYEAAIRLLRTIGPGGGISQVWVESVGKQDDVEQSWDKEDPVVRQFHSTLAELILSNVCSIRYLLRVSSPAMLESVLRAYVMPFSAAKSYAVKVAVLDQSLNTLSPLIIGESDTLIGIGREGSLTEACIHLHDEAATRVVMQYFDLLWNDRCAVTVREADGTSNQSIELLRHGLIFREALGPANGML